MGSHSLNKQREGIESCSEYDFKVVAVIGDKYSDETLETFITHPGVNAAEKLKPIIIPTSQGITAKWKGFEKLSCINNYVVAVCKEGNDCPESSNINRDNSLEFLQFSTKLPLEECSDYSLHIKPIFPGVNLYEKVVSFRTLSPPLANLTSKLTAIEAVASEEQMIKVKWNTIQCAKHYKVYQKINTPDGEWERIGITSKNYFKQGVKVSVDEEESEIVEFKRAVMSKLDKSGPYIPPNLQITETPDGARLSWDHGKCINHYRIRSCESEGHDRVCYEEQEVVENSEKHKVSHTITNLKPCSDYILEVYPSTSDGEFDAESIHNKKSNTPSTIKY
jgi:hypothetical protein